ncbi:MAG: ABC transporter permease [Verrucomicrobia bacterium]|nr:ABC transporter permease [Verrucomicrobiota bacterium]
MNLFNAIAVGFKEIWANKFRSLLTMLGIILGVSSLVAMSALVKGMENGLREALIAIGGIEKVRVDDQDIPASQLHLADQAVGCTMSDVYALQHSAPLVNLVMPEMRHRSVTMSREGKRFNPHHFAGTWPSALEMNQHVLEHGRMFNEVDDELARNVCVIGTATRNALFGSPEDLGREVNPVGEDISISGQRFRIIGMFEHYESEQDKKKREFAKLNPKATPAGPRRNRGYGSSSGRSSGSMGSFVFELKNSTVYIPLNTMWVKFRSTAGTNSTPDARLSGLSMKIRDIDEFETALQQARNVLMHTHRGIEDFSFRTQENWSEGITTSIHNARMSGGLIAAISLLVGGIGIMNIMLASITERVREIGIRKAVGASFLDVFVQILVESVVISVLGGLAGLGAANGLVKLLSVISPTENTPMITWDAMAVAFAFSVGVGILAGIFPAFKAARLNPIQALRYE